MIYSHWETGDYPILLDPDFTELDRLGLWDTLRICVDGEHIGIASGLGNTHQSITAAMTACQLSSGLPETYILFRDGDEYYFNLEDVSGQRRARPRPTFRVYFSDGHAHVLSDCIQLRKDTRLV